MANNPRLTPTLSTNETETIPALAKWISEFSFELLSKSSIEKTKLLILDTIGCAVAALKEKNPNIAINAALQFGGSEQAHIIGSPGQTSVTNAVFANCVLLRYLDLNDFFVQTSEEDIAIRGHQSDNIPVALAVGERQQNPGREIIASVALGYELYSRLRKLMDRAGSWDGTTVSGLVAPAMAGYLIGISEDKMAHALALGASRSATPAIMRAGIISGGKYLANAMIAQTGTQCAELAAQGLTGPFAIVEHPRGLRQVYPNLSNKEILLTPYSQNDAVLAATIKSYPCVATSQTLVSAALELKKELSDNIDKIECITITMAEALTVREHQTDTARLNPESREAADHSFTFLTAVALIDGELTPRQFDNERWNEKAIRNLMNRISLTTNESLNALDPNGFPSRVEIQMKDGTVLEATAARPPGTTEEGTNADAVLTKFKTITENIISANDQKFISNTVMALDQTKSISPLMEQLSTCCQVN